MANFQGIINSTSRLSELALLTIDPYVTLTGWETTRWELGETYPVLIAGGYDILTIQTINSTTRITNETAKNLNTYVTLTGWEITRWAPGDTYPVIITGGHDKFLGIVPQASTRLTDEETKKLASYTTLTNWQQDLWETNEDTSLPTLVPDVLVILETLVIIANSRISESDTKKKQTYVDKEWVFNRGTDWAIYEAFSQPFLIDSPTTTMHKISEHFNNEGILDLTVETFSDGFHYTYPQFETTINLEAIVSPVLYVNIAETFTGEATLEPTVRKWNPMKDVKIKDIDIENKLLVVARPYTYIAPDPIPDEMVPPKGTIHDDETSSVPMYSANRLFNGDAETGTVAPWVGNGGSIVDGGVEGSTKVFKLDAHSQLKQVLSSGGAQPPDYRIKGKYFPEEAITQAHVQVKAFVRVTLTYADGSKDIAILPVREAEAHEA